MTFNFLKKQLIAKGDKEALLSLVMATIDDVVNTVVRQIGFSNFERRLHGIDKSYQNWNEPKKLSVEDCKVSATAKAAIEKAGGSVKSV